MNGQMARALATPQTPAPATPAQPGMPTDETWINKPSDAAAQIADARIAAAMAPALTGLQSMAQMQATTMRALASERFKDTFLRWGPEVDTLMANVAPEQRTLDNYEKVVKYVRANHEDEIVQERARAMMAAGGLSERSGGLTGVPGTNPVIYDPDKLPAGMGEVAKRHGLTENMVVEWCKKNGWTTERWMTEFNNGKVFTSTSPFTSEMNDQQLGIARQYGE